MKNRVSRNDAPPPTPQTLPYQGPLTLCLCSSAPVCPSHGPAVLSELAPRGLAETQGHPPPQQQRDRAMGVGTTQWVRREQASSLMPFPHCLSPHAHLGQFLQVPDALPVTCPLPTRICKWPGRAWSRKRSPILDASSLTNCTVAGSNNHSNSTFYLAET